MSTQENYVNKIEKTMEKYSDKISKIDKALKSYKSKNKSELLTQRDDLQDKYNEAEKMVKKLKSATEKDFEKIKESASEVFDNIKEAFQDFSSFLSMEHLYEVKDEIVDYGAEQVEKVEKLAKEHPITVAVGALSLGFIIGTLFSRSR